MQYGLIGEHLGHSYSKIIHEKLLEQYTYEIHPVSKIDFDQFMIDKNFKAINVTIPYKEKVLPYLQTLDPKAQKIQAVNTIVNKEGKLIGYNTDYDGFLYLLKKHGISIQDKKVILLGNGGACKACKAVIEDQNPKAILITSRCKNNDTITIQDAYTQHNDADLIINTTPCGMYPIINEQAIDLSKFDHLNAVIDIIYNPYNTRLILQARELNILAVSGLEMLVAQAKKALEHFKSITIDDSRIEEIYQEIIDQTTNLIVIEDEKKALQLSKEKHKELSKITNETIEQNAFETNKIFLVAKETYDRYKDLLLINCLMDAV